MANKPKVYGTPTKVYGHGPSHDRMFSENLPDLDECAEGEVIDEYVFNKSMIVKKKAELVDKE